MVGGGAGRGNVAKGRSVSLSVPCFSCEPAAVALRIKMVRSSRRILMPGDQRGGHTIRPHECGQGSPNLRRPGPVFLLSGLARDIFQSCHVLCILFKSAPFAAVPCKFARCTSVGRSVANTVVVSFWLPTRPIPVTVRPAQEWGSWIVLKCSSTSRRFAWRRSAARPE